MPKFVSKTIPKAPLPTRARNQSELGLVLATLGLLGATILPFVFYSLASDEAIRESKLFVQALFGAVALVGLALEGRGQTSAVLAGPAESEASTEPDASPNDIARRALLVARTAVAAAGILIVASALRAFRVIDPLFVVPVLSGAALFWVGASWLGPRLASRVFPVLMVAGAATAILATLQMTYAPLRMDVRAPAAQYGPDPLPQFQPRHLATGLIGNPGDVACALVIPALLLWMLALQKSLRREYRLLALGGFAATVLGVGSTGTVSALAAIFVGVLGLGLLDWRRNRKALLVAFVAALAVVALSDAGQRIVQKIGQVTKGDLSLATTQRDIGVLAAFEMIRENPGLGVGPGAFANRFVPARLLAESRSGRALVHLSGSSQFDNAHSEPLTWAAECGVLASLLLVLALGALFVGLLGTRSGEKSEKSDQGHMTAFVLLLAMAFLSLGNFPTRMPVSAGLAALVAGLAWGQLRRESGEPARPRVPKKSHAFGLIAFAVALFVGAGVRYASVRLQAEGERLLHEAAAAPETERAEPLAGARRALVESLALRPRKATAWLALGSAWRLDGELANAQACLIRSFRLEERAETNYNLALVALAEGRERDARELFLRAIWILPVLLDSLPGEYDVLSLRRERQFYEWTLKPGGRVPPVPRVLVPSVPPGA